MVAFGGALQSPGDQVWVSFPWHTKRLSAERGQQQSALGEIGRSQGTALNAHGTSETPRAHQANELAMT
jgi:hypothetical protein